MAWKRTAVALLFLLASSGVLFAENIDPLNKYAWSENAGWINAQPTGPGGPGMQVDEFELTGWMWAENFGWISLDCSNTSSCATVDYGVNNSGGVLSGYAWAENAGWVSFSCANTGSCGTASYGVVIDSTTGSFSGHAWAENFGWISFESMGPNPFQLKANWTCSVPVGSPSVTLDKAAGGMTQLDWAPLPGATGFDVTRGDLGLLRSSGGNYTGSILDCVEDNTPAVSALHGGDPAPGEAFWFLVRAADCGGGTYDGAGPSQAAPRDAGIANSGAGCP
ncbi:MAG: hypothetical protein OES25_10235 [Acidobacteriota bacterium]|nr:hypothetical protein [Acidobacteriota bacterium]